MHRSPVLRIVLAAFLAFWTPAMCCCTVKSWMSGADECGQRSCCVMGGSYRSTAADQPTSCCEQKEDESDSKPDSLPCKCHEKSIELTRLDTGGKITVPALQVEMGQMAFITPSPLIVIKAEEAWVVRCPVIRHHPPPNTLLAQRCLLLI